MTAWCTVRTGFSSVGQYRGSRKRKFLTGLGHFATLALTVFVAGIAPPVFAASYEYDVFGRLTRVVHDDGALVSYTYDVNGNRTQVAAMTGALFLVNDVSVVEGGTLVFTVTRVGATVLSQNVSYGQRRLQTTPPHPAFSPSPLARPPRR